MLMFVIKHYCWRKGSVWDTLNTVVSPGWKSRWLRSPNLGGGVTVSHVCAGVLSDLGPLFAQSLDSKLVSFKWLRAPWSPGKQSPVSWHCMVSSDDCGDIGNNNRQHADNWLMINIRRGNKSSHVSSCFHWKGDKSCCASCHLITFTRVKR